ncbi:IQ domain-containing protein D-like [Asbolus verrucosus]|uniref:Dynein regulatory complex protein 10 n=1 Tax=Asbolus verrucosus TaxID=1661398 RepID=A0A482V8X3_ASBVE|nr:IQ domain-containing protein D-like [Asbolus verrucosus]
MKEKLESSSYKQNEENVRNVTSNEFKLQSDRIRKVLDEAIYKLNVLVSIQQQHLLFKNDFLQKVLPTLLQNDGEILRKYLSKSEADFIILLYQENYFSKQSVEDRSDLMLISNMLDRINMFERSRGSSSMKKEKSFLGADNYEMHVAYAVDIIFKSKPLVEYMQTVKEKHVDSLVTNFIEAMLKLREIADDRLRISASEEIKRENDLKTAYRSSMMLSDNIQELEAQLEKQRQELGKEYDRKQAILEDLDEKIVALKDKAKQDINQIIYDSEILMMKDYNKSTEVQQELAEEAKDTTHQYDVLLEDHLAKEKTLRAKRFKVETQLASWVAKYDQDLGDKQAEFEALEKTYNTEKEDFELLQEKFDEQEEEYVVLMAEKEAEEMRIKEEKAWIFLQNRSARRIQRYWRAYRARKLAKKKGRKGKKKGSAEKGHKDKKSPKGKQEEATTLRGGPDPNALIESKFNTELLADIQQQDAFAKKDVVVDLVE